MIRLNSLKRLMREMKYNKTFHSDSEKDTIAIGFKLSRVLKEGSIVLLDGKLGTGKTHLVKGIVKGIGGYDVDNVVSPTYTIVNVYEANIIINHIDFYRIESLDRTTIAEFDEYLFGSAITLIEWPGSLIDFLEDDDFFSVRFSINSNFSRDITLSNNIIDFDSNL